mgnify:CR=1 FL=1
MLTVILYTRAGCHLCQEAKAELQALQGEFPHRLVEVDIEQDSALQTAYALEIPVVEVGPYRLKAPFTPQELRVTLSAASDRRNHLQNLDSEGYERLVQRSQEITTADRISYLISRHYLAIINLVLFLYVGLPFLAPMLMKAGLPGVAGIIYTGYSPLCHQFGFRSWYLFGEQAYYPLAEADIPGVKDFETASGITGLHDASGWARLQARNFRGNETVGYKVALCQRDVAIYASMLLFGLIFALTGRRFKSMHWLLWFVLALGPIGLDGFSQLISQFSFSALAEILPYRESTPLLRTLTGFLFGFATAWFAFPNIEENMQEVRNSYAKKFVVAEAIVHNR